MAYKNPPWDISQDAWKTETNKVERIRAIASYLQSERSSTVRSKTEKDARVIWNGAPAPPSGLCVIYISLDKSRTTTEWSGMIEDSRGDRIDGSRQGRTKKMNGKSYQHPYPASKDKFLVNFSSRDVVTFVFGGPDLVFRRPGSL